MKLGAIVEQLHPPTRRWLGMQAAIVRLARDPTSRLAAVRDVALWMLPGYLPDPRVGAAECRRIASVEAANRRDWCARYACMSRNTVDGRAVFRDFKTGIDFPTGIAIWAVKFVRNYVLLMTRVPINRNIYVFTVDGQLLAIARFARYLGHGWISCDTFTLLHPVDLHFEESAANNRTVITPCGIRTSPRDNTYCYWGQQPRSVAAASYHSSKVFDDYGEPYGDDNMYIGASAELAEHIFTFFICNLIAAPGK